MPSPERTQEREYERLFFDLVEPFLPRLPQAGTPMLRVSEQKEFADSTKRLAEVTNNALYSLQQHEKIAAFTNSERAGYLTNFFSPYEKLECTAYLVRYYLPLRTWAHEDVGHFLNLALTERIENVTHTTYLQALRTQVELRKRLNSPPQQPRRG